LPADKTIHLSMYQHYGFLPVDNHNYLSPVEPSSNTLLTVAGSR